MRLLGILVLCLSILFSASLPAKTNPGYAIASAHPLATKAGLEILAKGGNAFDAAVAVAAVLAVVEPYHSGLGGGGFWLLRDGKTGQNIFIDSRETAPMAARPDMFLDAKGQVQASLSLNGGLAAAIPGEPAALDYISKHYGHLPLSISLAPAIHIARTGFIVDKQLVDATMMKDRLDQMRKYKATSTIFLKQGQPYAVGDRLVQKDLAASLELLAKQGQEGFYKGKLAEAMVKSVNQAGGIWTLKDLAHYQIKLRKPLEGQYHSMHIVTAPPPSAGGPMLIMMLHILEGFSLESLDKAQWVQRVAEAMKLTYWQRSYFGDPDFVSIPLEKLLSKQEAKRLREKIIPNHALESAKLQLSQVREHNNTSHISIRDAAGNQVSATLSINYIFGSALVASGTGILLNDEMDDFATKPGSANVYGLPGAEQNAIAAGKRPLSSMAPSFLDMPGRAAIVGTPGGSRIPSMILLASLAFYDYQGAISMVSRMRFHHQYLPDKLEYEPESFSPQLIEQLKKMAYQLHPLNSYYGDMQAISWDYNSGFITAASDPRHIGLAVADNAAIH